jgi:hypothetical protein
VIDFPTTVRMTFVPGTPQIIFVLISVLMVVVDVPVIDFVLGRFVILSFGFVIGWHTGFFDSPIFDGKDNELPVL